ncbi:CD225/dispanin family protein [Luteimonas sp. S4-F44]|uniref:CD225/dispanin family protein n=1 Tax=Luteimonas sp. S4-F44 TaxID=2925842 RepID=UPI001F53425A|nr:CD225/dispanin family protein [Luteimonas sp. S4-F44]UNK41989.1 CD225/dispanin family protein [Luteimonas sp. S4-F44]
MSTIPPPPPPPNPYDAPGTPLPGTPIAPGTVPNHLAWSIIATVLSLCLCCIVGTIPGIVAIVFSAKVNTLLGQGDLAGAQRASNTAKTWCWVTTGLCIIGLLWTIYSLTLGGGMEQYQMIFDQIQSDI